MQRAVVNEQEFYEQVLQEAELPCGNEQDASLPAFTIPFPARFTESPYIEIQNVAGERKRQALGLWNKGKKLFATLLIMLFAYVTPAGIAFSFFPSVILSGPLGFFGSVATRLFPVRAFDAVRDLYADESSGATREVLQATVIVQLLLPLIRVLGLDRVADWTGRKASWS